MPAFTLDFEASCLPRHGRSFPIEVGVVDPGGRVRSWLIRPVPEWRRWCWTQEAERLHGLTWNRLMDEGRPATCVWRELAAILDGRPAYADSGLDVLWMRTLEEAAGVATPLTVRHIDALLDRLGLDDNAVALAIAATSPDGLRRHRAGDDALWLHRFLIRALAGAVTEETSLSGGEVSGALVNGLAEADQRRKWGAPIHG